MALFPNASISSFYTGRSFGPAVLDATNLRNGALRARHTGSTWSAVSGGTPVGVGNGALALPIIRGSMSAFSRTTVNVGSAPIQEGREMSGDTAMSFTVTPADLLLTALLSGSAAITFNVPNSSIGAAVGIAGSTSFAITPSAPVLGALAGVSGSTSMAISSSSTLTGYGALTGNITPYTELSPQSLASAVWGAVATQFNEAGTLGNKLNSAASGGVDYAALGQAVWAVILADADTPGSMGAFIQSISGGGGSSLTAEEISAAVAAHAQTLTVGKFLALKD